MTMPSPRRYAAAPLWQRRRLLALIGAAPLLHLSACGGGASGSAELNAPAQAGSAIPKNSFTPQYLVADTHSRRAFSPVLTGIKQELQFLDAWGIAIRPAGHGGHFWVMAGGYCYEFLGDVQQSGDTTLRSIKQDALRVVGIPGAGQKAGVTDEALKALLAELAAERTEEGDGDDDDEESEAQLSALFDGFATGVVFNGAPITSDLFVVSNQSVTRSNGTTATLSGSARFIFATDSGKISGWTERNAADGSVVREDGSAALVFDGTEQGMSLFGLAIRPDTWNTLWAADFGAEPQIRQFNANWELVPTQGFVNPFIPAGATPSAGDYVPFNIQVLNWLGTSYAFVTYAALAEDPEHPGQALTGEEDSLAAADEGERPNRGRVAMFTLDGTLVKVLNDDKRLNAPWGVAIAPSNFGMPAGTLLVGNFAGNGRVACYDLGANRFVDFLRLASGNYVRIPGLWGLQFGNGASLGDSNALYFAAGPGEEVQGVFGAIRFSA